MNRIILLAAFMFVAGSTYQVHCQNATPQGEILTLEQAIDIALRNNRSAKNAQLDVQKTHDKTAALKTRRLPNLKLTTLFSKPLTTFDTTFEKGLFGTFEGIGPIPAEDTLVESQTNATALVVAQVTQPVTQLRRIGLQIKQQEIGHEIAQTQLRAKEQATVNEVKRAYYAVLQTQGAARAAQEAVKLYHELDRVTGEYVLQQVALKTDHMDVQTRLAKSEYEVMTLTNRLSSQKEQLNHLLGRDVNMDFSVTDGMEAAQVTMRETDLSQARERALAQRPELREAALRIEQSKLDRRAKKTEFIPDVSLTLNYISTFNYSNFVPRNITGLGVQIEWEVFDWGRKKREINEKDRTISQAENNLKETQSQILMQVNNQYRRLQETCQLIRVARLGQTAARANVQMVAYKYRLDAVLLKDVLQAQTSLANADYEYQQALLSFWTAKADFEKAIGEDR
ncbi:MAG TPA: TolC family protein [Pyrinomonadaceae bacterium]|nr:TolC family protein [Pyrinomonadaceae bacterium]